MTTSCSLVPQNNTIDGNVETPAIELGEFLTDPDTGEKLQAQLSSSTEQVERAITAATELHRSGVWTRRSVADRVRLLERTAELVEERTAAIAREDSKNNGLPLLISTLFAGGLPDLFRSAARHLENSSGFEQLPSGAHLHRLAWGPTAVIAPWNAPSFITAKKTAFALAAGAPVIAKPSNWAPSGQCACRGDLACHRRTRRAEGSVSTRSRRWGRRASTGLRSTNPSTGVHRRPSSR